MQLRSLIIVLLSFHFCFVSAQSSISFYSNTELANLLQIAQEQDKNIFVDTYAKWCKPCKKQDLTFMDDQVAAYFNSNFINVKYDMDTEIGKAIDLKYEVVFLPTVLILDKYGNVRIKMDNGVLSPKELLNIAKAITEPYTPAPTTTPAPVAAVPAPILKEEVIATAPAQKRANPIIKPTEPVNNTSEEAGEKILFVLDGDTELPPEILLQEAYFRMQLMDGTHREAARKYLETQQELLTEVNIKFIHDFVYTTRSEEYNFLVENIDKFNAHLGEEKVRNTLEHLIYNTLYNGYPRPTLEKAIELFGHIDPHNNVVNAHKYFLTRLHDEENKSKYLEFAERYLIKRNKEDHVEMRRLSETYILETPDKKQIKESEKWIDKAIKLNGNDPLYFEQRAKIKLLKEDKKEAIKAIEKAITLATNQEKDIPRLQEFLDKLKTQ